MKPKKLKLHEALLLYSKIKHLINPKDDLDELVANIRIAKLGAEIYEMFYSDTYPEDDFDQHTSLMIALEDNNFEAFIFFVMEITDGR